MIRLLILLLILTHSMDVNAKSNENIVMVKTGKFKVKEGRTRLVWNPSGYALYEVCLDDKPGYILEVHSTLKTPHNAKDDSKILAGSCIIVQASILDVSIIPTKREPDIYVK